MLTGPQRTPTTPGPDPLLDEPVDKPISDPPLFEPPAVGPQPSPQPPAPISTSGSSCGLDLLGLLVQLLRDEVVVVGEVLELDVPGALSAQIEAVRNLLLGLGHRCTPAQAATLVRAAG